MGPGSSCSAHPPSQKLAGQVPGTVALARGKVLGHDQARGAAAGARLFQTALPKPPPLAPPPLPDPSHPRTPTSLLGPVQETSSTSVPPYSASLKSGPGGVAGQPGSGKGEGPSQPSSPALLPSLSHLTQNWTLGPSLSTAWMPPVSETLWVSPGSQAGDAGVIPGSGRPPGVGNGNPCQDSCLGNPMDRGAFWAAVHGVARESDTT